jgi:ribonuclease HII
MMAKFDRSLLPEAPGLSEEQALWQTGVVRIGGIDEAGRGAWAGPVVAAVVILPPNEGLSQELHGVRDSKEMTPSQRQTWAEIIKLVAAAWAVGLASHAEVDRSGILPATRLAARRALEQLSDQPEYLLIDYLVLPEIRLPQLALVKGDARVLSIACASVLAKTARDALMVEMDAVYPGYGFARHKGYGTRLHQEALHSLGPSPIHRLSFTPVKALLPLQ